MCTLHVCAHRTLQRVPLNTRCTFKQSSMFNDVGINCSHVAMCTCKQQKSRDRTRRTSHVCAHRTLQRVPLNTRYTFKQLSEFNSVGLNCSYVAMCMCRCRRDRTRRTSHVCAHRTLQRVPLNTRYTLKQLSDLW
jgi:hypothetical protein